MNAPTHVAQASAPVALATDIAAERELLRLRTVETAFSLLDGDYLSAARSAYRAAWHYHRLPADVQAEYVATELVADTGPAATESEWSSSAFVAWLLYRCNRLAASVRVYSSAAGAPIDVKRSLSAESNQNAPETLDFVQEGMTL